MSVSACLCVCMHAYQEPHIRSSPNFLRVACGRVSVLFWCSVAICGVLPVLLTTSCFATMGPMALATQYEAA